MRDGTDAREEREAHTIRGENMKGNNARERRDARGRRRRR